MRSSGLQKSLRLSSSAAFYMTASATPFKRRCSNRIVVLPLFLTKMFLTRSGQKLHFTVVGPIR